MLLGVCSWSFERVLRDRDVVEIAAAACAAGFECFEAAWTSRSAFASPDSAPRATDVPIANLATLELHRAGLFHPAEARRAHARAVVSHMIETARRWEIPTLSVSPGPGRGEQPAAAELDELITELAPMVDEASRAGVQLLLENVCGHALDTLEAMSAALDALPRAGLCLDLGNTLAGVPAEEWLARLSKRVELVHVSDGCLRDGALVAALPGRGALDWRPLRAPLDALPDRVNAVVEVPLARGAREAQLLPDVHAAARAALGR